VKGCWDNYKHGINPVEGLTINDIDPDLQKLIKEFDRYYERNFSNESVMIEYLKTLIKVSIPKGVL
jgi:hypothetical protein